MSADLLYALDQLEKEKGIRKDIIIEAIEAALVSAYKKNFGSTQSVKVRFVALSGEFKVYAMKKMLVPSQNESNEGSINDEQKDETYQEEEYVEVEVTPRKFGRIAAQTAKQVVVQRLRDAEKGMIFDELISKEGEIIHGIVRKIDRKQAVLELERAEATLPTSEQISSEVLNFNDRIRVYVIEVKKSSRGLTLIVSRTHPGLVKRLFEREVPEILDGTVEIRSISREPGSRTKIAVFSKDDNVDPVGACVGQKGTRVQAIVDELRGEKIDIIKWSSNPEEYISSSLSPAKVVKVDIFEQEKSARVIVPDFQLSLAIGKEGQNARLAAKLTGWKIDIKSQSQIMGQLFGDGPKRLFNDNFDNDSPETRNYPNDLFLNNGDSNYYNPDDENDNVEYQEYDENDEEFDGNDEEIDK